MKILVLLGLVWKVSLSLLPNPSSVNKGYLVSLLRNKLHFLLGGALVAPARGSESEGPRLFGRSCT